MAVLRILGIAAAMAAIALPAGAMPNTMQNMHNMMAKHSLDINMGAQNGSKQTGSATVKDVKGGVLVTVKLMNEPKTASEPTHIHAGTCAKLNPAPWKPLKDTVGGSSVTMVKGVSVADLKKTHYAINVHESAANLGKYVSCGDL